MVIITDIYSKEKRSKVMAKIRGRETKPEILVRKYLFSKGVRYRLHDEKLPGKPDIVLPKYHTAIFIHGCFWHGHPDCKKSKLPATNTGFWEKKISGNIKRDKRNVEELKSEGLNVIVVWGCEIASKADREERLKQLIEEINANR